MNLLSPNLVLSALVFVASVLYQFCDGVVSGDDETNLDKLLTAIGDALTSGGAADQLSRRPQSGLYYPPNNGISLGVYEALKSITRNDDLECVPRLLCEAAAGGRPGFSGRQQLHFDKSMLTRFISYLNVGASRYSPLLVFARAALLGVSNRGDPYACIINYAKCPKDQSRLLHYLNNHRGGFFRYFDTRDQSSGNYYYHTRYRPEYSQPEYSAVANQLTRTKVRFESVKSDFADRLKKKTATGYAKRYPYSSPFKFPGGRDVDAVGRRKRKPMVFPEGRIVSSEPGKPVSQGLRGDLRLPKKVSGSASGSSFFPRHDRGVVSSNSGGGLVTDRLPSKFHFPLLSDVDLSSPSSSSSSSSRPSRQPFFPLS